MRVRNTYHKKLAFNIDGKPFGIEANEIKEVDEKLGKELLNNYWIEEIKEKKAPEIKKAPEVPKYQIPKVEKTRRYKGRKKQRD